MTLILSPPITRPPTRRFTHQVTSTDSTVAPVLIMWDPQQEGFVAELYEPHTPLEREAAFLVLGTDPPCRTVEDLEDQLGDRIQPLSQTVREALSADVLVDLCSRIHWQFIPGQRHALSATTPLSVAAVQLCGLAPFEPDEWGRDTRMVRCGGMLIECCRDTADSPATCSLLSHCPTHDQYRLTITF